uniref:MFS transporter n=1 Tax=Cyberlindnera americana TaxID=36016 RepID=A0A5P8N8P4_9ASCO|nr:MFS transporter [Cyberlindnera americana]
MSTEEKSQAPDVFETQSSVESVGEIVDVTMDNTEAENGDVVLQQKIRLINDAIDQIGFTYHHFKLFCIAGFGYSIDSQMEMIQSSVKVYVDYQMKRGTDFPVSNEVFYVGLILGSIFFGMGCDLIGRKVVFNSSVFLTSIFGFLTGGMDNYPMYCIFMALSAFAAGGNIATDVSVFLEYLPTKHQYLNTVMAMWWGVGMTIAALISWAFIPNNSCSSADYCPSHINRGWRYCWYVNSGICLFAALLRVFVLKMDETPKFLVSVGKDREAFEVLKKISDKYNRPMSLTLEQLEKCGTINPDYYDVKKDGYSFKALLRTIKVNLKILFQSPRVIRSTVLVFLSWGFIGISYSTFYNFLYIFIASHGGDTGSTTYLTYRNATLDNFAGIFGPILAGGMILIKFKAFGKNIVLGRRGTMAFGAIASMAILFGYTTVRTPAGDAGFGSATYFFVNIYYATLYAYTPEIFPTKARGTGVGAALVVGRTFGIFAPVVYYYGAKSSSAVPIWVCGAIIGCLSIFSLLMPFEPSLKRAV